jgi:exopolysaccharide biosynthesis predicted pyruvyltransferase EpsI
VTEVVEPCAVLRERFGGSKRFVWMPNGGNLGDALIAQATVQAFERSGLRWGYFSTLRHELGADDVLVYGGGGALTDLHDGAFDCLDELFRHGLPVVVLPSTARGRTDYWERCPRLTVFCRDRSSLGYLQTFGRHDVLLADDLAVGLDMTAGPFAGITEYRRALVATGQLVDGPLVVLRGDAEGGQQHRPDAVDVSVLWYPDMADPAQFQAGAVLLLLSIAPFRRVVTDRLHVAIACGLLGVECSMRPDRYRKLTGVYELSLRDRFPTVHWAG